MWLFVIFVAVPLIEIALFIQVGGAIGLWPTLLIVVLTAIAGSWLMRAQGLAALTNIRSSFSDLRDPTEPLAHGAMILFAGAMLLTPGFFTDTLGFLMLIPPVRAAAFRYLRTRIKVQSFATRSESRPEPRDEGVIDAEFHEVPPDQRPTHSPSGWTRH